MLFGFYREGYFSIKGKNNEQTVSENFRKIKKKICRDKSSVMMKKFVMTKSCHEKKICHDKKCREKRIGHGHKIIIVHPKNRISSMKKGFVQLERKMLT